MTTPITWDTSYLGYLIMSAASSKFSLSLIGIGLRTSFDLSAGLVGR